MRLSRSHLLQHTAELRVPVGLGGSRRINMLNFSENSSIDSSKESLSEHSPRCHAAYSYSQRVCVSRQAASRSIAKLRSNTISGEFACPSGLAEPSSPLFQIKPQRR